MGFGGFDFIPGMDFIPGSDFIPGITDILGIDFGLPGIDIFFGGDNDGGGGGGGWDTVTGWDKLTGNDPTGGATGWDKITGWDQLSGIDKVSGLDKIPGIDNIPGYDKYAPGIDQAGADQTGIGFDNWAPGIDQAGADQTGIGFDNWAPGIDQAGSDQTGIGQDNWAPGIDQAGADQTGIGSDIQQKIKDYLDKLNGGAGTGTGTKTGTGTGYNAPSQSQMIDIRGDVLGGTAPIQLGGLAASAVPLANVGSTSFNPISTKLFAKGGLVADEDGNLVEHNPEFFSEGGLENRYVKGDGDGTSDSVPAMLATGEFVIPADVIASLGNGDNDSGSAVMDDFIRSVREHKQENGPDELPPDSKGVLEYITIAQGKAK